MAKMRRREDLDEEFHTDCRPLWEKGEHQNSSATGRGGTAYKLK